MKSEILLTINILICAATLLAIVFLLCSCEEQVALTNASIGRKTPTFNTPQPQ